MIWFDRARIPNGRWPFLLTAYNSLKRLEESQVPNVDLTEGTGALTITGCLEAYRQAVNGRVIDLSQAIVAAWNGRCPIGAIVCGRALLETLAMFHSLLKQAESAATRRDWIRIGKLVDAYAFSVGSSHKRPSGEHPPRVGTAVIDFIRSTEPGAEKFWSQICDTAHPNGKRMMSYAGELRDLRFEAHLAGKVEGELFIAVFNCLSSCNWLVSANEKFDILLEQIRTGDSLPKDHPLMVEKARVDELVQKMVAEFGRHMHVGPEEKK